MAYIRLSLLVFSGLLFSINVLSQDITTGLIAYYPFSGDATDASGNGNNGTVSNATLTTDKDGNSNSAYYFNGTNAKITLLSSNSAIAGAQPRTIAFWAKMADTQFKTMFQMGSQTGCGSEYALMSDGSVQLWGGSGCDFGGFNPSLTVNSWHHFAMTYDGTAVQVYVDGCFKAIASRSLSTSISALVLGYWNYANSYFTGALDEVRVYSRALGPSDLAVLMGAPMTFTSFGPGSSGSGGTVTITGTNLYLVSSVTFGGVAASSFSVLSPTAITAVVGSGTSGSVSIVSACNQNLSLGGFTFIPSPTISSFTPTNAGSGTTVTVTGTNFTGATAVSFGGTPATSFTVVSSTQIDAVVANGTSGNVSVTTTGGTASLAGFTFIPAPTISSFTPTSAGSGTTVTITGTNFSGATAVSFGATAAASYAVVSPTQITAVVASGSSGNISVTTPGGTATLAGFTFIPAPTISSFTPTSAVSGTTVTISGTNFTGATAVSFGGTAATSFIVVSSNQIDAVVGNGTSGSVSITTPGGTASQAGFISLTPPTITSFSPSSAGSGTTVTITGTNFIGATAVSFGGTAATSFTVVASTTAKSGVIDHLYPEQIDHYELMSKKCCPI